MKLEHHNQTSSKLKTLTTIFDTPYSSCGTKSIKKSKLKNTHFEQLSAINGITFLQDKNYLRQYMS